MRSSGSHFKGWRRFVAIGFHYLQLSLDWDLQSGKAHERTADQLKDELETLQQQLELILRADPGVIDQYERRKEDVCSIVLLLG